MKYINVFKNDKVNNLKPSHALLAAALLACSGLTSAANAATLFSDSFESVPVGKGLTPRVGNDNFVWGDNIRVTASTDYAHTGKQSLKFRFPGKPAATDPKLQGADDAYAEQRFRFTKPQTDFWLSYWIRFPENYKHRVAAGTNNNKFIALWSKSYRDPGNRLIIQARAEAYYGVADPITKKRPLISKNGNSGSDWVTYTHHIQGEKFPIGVGLSPKQSPDMVPQNLLIDRSTDLGKWIKVVLHFKRATNATSRDGVVQLYKVVDGKNVPVLDMKNVQNWGPATHGDPAYNYIDRGYLLGWSNSGFDEDTKIYIDDFEFSTTPPKGFTTQTLTNRTTQ